MRKYLKYLIIILILIIGVIIGFIIVKKIKSHKEINLTEVTVEDINNQDKTLEERLFAQLLKITGDFYTPWDFKKGVVSIEYKDTNLPIFKWEYDGDIYTFELTEDGILWRITKIGEFTQGDLDAIFVYGGDWDITTEGLLNILTLKNIDTFSYMPDFEDLTESTEKPIELKPISLNTTVDVSTISQDDRGKENLTDEQNSYLYSYSFINNDLAPWKNLNYELKLINAEDGIFEILINTEQVQYRLRVSKGGNFYRFYKNVPFNDQDKLYINDMIGTWEEVENIDNWYVMKNIEYYNSDTGERG